MQFLKRNFFMFTFRMRQFFGLFISFSMLVAPLPLSAIAQEIAMNISEIEAHVIMENPDVSYIYLGKDRSNIADIINQLCPLDDNNNSALHKLYEHIENGF